MADSCLQGQRYHCPKHQLHQHSDTMSTHSSQSSTQILLIQQLFQHLLQNIQQVVLTKTQTRGVLQEAASLFDAGSGFN